MDARASKHMEMAEPEVHGIRLHRKQKRQIRMLKSERKHCCTQEYMQITKLYTSKAARKINNESNEPETVQNYMYIRKAKSCMPVWLSSRL